MSTNQSAFGSLVEFSCDECYHLEGESHLTCLENGTWSGARPTCSLSSCRDLVAPKNGAKSTNKTSCGSTVGFSCDECYELKGHKQLSCLPNRTWSGEEPICAFVYCPALEVPANGAMTQTAGNSCGSSAWFTCNSGYGMIGSGYRDCTTEGFWRGVTVSCHKVSELTVKLQEAWSHTPVDEAIITIRVVGSDTTRLYQQIFAHSDTLVITVPAEVQILVSTEADGYLATSLLFFTHHLTKNFLPVYMQRPLGSVLVQYTSSYETNVTFRALDKDIRLHLPPNALDVASGSDVNLTLSSVNLSAAALCVPQLIGETGVDTSSRVYLNPYAIIHVGYGNSISARLLRPIYLYVPAVLTGFPVKRLSTWFYNEDRAAWQRTNATALKEQMVVFEISRFGWWSAAVDWTDTSCTSVRVSWVSYDSPKPSPLPGSLVWLMGVDYFYSSVQGTDAMGVVCLEQKNHSSSVFRVENERFGISSGPISIWTSNGGECMKERWLHTTGTQASCSSLDILLAVCSPLGRLLNGRVNASPVISLQGDVNRPAVTMFECDLGFELIGPRNRTCLANGTWSDYQPECRLVECDSLEEPTNGKKHGDARIFAATVFFSCEIGYVLTGSANRTCLADGTWSGNDTFCNPINCGPFPTKQTVSVSGSQTTFPNHLVFSCDSGYELKGSSISQCQANGIWSATDVECKAVSCGSLPSIKNGKKFGSGNITLRFTVRFECDHCFHLEGSSTRTCQADKTWSGTNTTCSREYI
jgi:hypothetical protein